MTDEPKQSGGPKELELPEGAELVALNAAIAISLEQEARGEVRPMEHVLARLRERRR